MERCRDEPFRPIIVDSIAMKYLVDELRGRSLRGQAVRVSRRPGGVKFVVSPSQTLGTRPVAGSQRGRFIEEEQLGITSGRHHLAMPSLELENAVDPALEPPLPPDLPVLVVQEPPVAHQRAALRRGDDGSKGRDPVLSRNTVRL